MSEKQSRKQRKDTQITAQSGDSFLLAQKHEEFSGPLPHPDILSRYDAITPGAADRIISMAEREENHRHAMEEQALAAQVRDNLLGAIFAIVAFVVWSGTTILLFYFAFHADTSIAQVGFAAIGTVWGGSGMRYVIPYFLSKK